jgi:tRNA (uracil-5-)-methyltransferase TRM9
MDRKTVEQLLDINHQFYQTFAGQFSQTRQRIQPGVRRVMERIPPNAKILDLGCGNGGLWRELCERGHTGLYVGLDNSHGLLEIARQQNSSEGINSPIFLQVDLAAPDWETVLGQHIRSIGNINFPLLFDRVLAFAVLHHLPGAVLRQQLLEKIIQLISPEGQFIHSEWQFMNSPKLKQRIQPWSLAGLEDLQLDRGDYLLDWRHGGKGLRYIHQFDEAELSELAEKSHFRICNTFYSDGENEKLGLYQVWTAVK